MPIGVSSFDEETTLCVITTSVRLLIDIYELYTFFPRKRSNKNNQKR